MKKVRPGVYVPVVSAIFLVIGGVLGAVLPDYLQRTRDIERSVLELRQKAYSEFFQGQSLLWSDSHREKEANQLIDSSKLRILLTSSGAVVSSMSDYWKTAKNLKECEKPEDMKKDVAIYQAMRTEFFKALDLGDPKIEIQVLVRYLRLCNLPETTADKRS